MPLLQTSKALKYSLHVSQIYPLFVGYSVNCTVVWFIAECYVHHPSLKDSWWIYKKSWYFRSYEIILFPVFPIAHPVKTLHALICPACRQNRVRLHGRSPMKDHSTDIILMGNVLYSRDLILDGCWNEQKSLSPGAFADSNGLAGTALPPIFCSIAAKEDNCWVEGSCR